MKKLIILSILFVTLFVIIFISCKKDELDVTPVNSIVQPVPDIKSHLPQPDHIIFVWFENKDYSQIIYSPDASYINSLIPQGTLFTDFHALGHPSYPQYISFFAGSPNGKADDACINGAPFSTPNLYTQLAAKGKTFAWYSEDLPATGSGTCTSGAYAEKHNPTTAFSNVPQSANKKLSDFPTNFNNLETVVCVTPNQNNDMHNGTIRQGDDWLRAHFATLVTWCKTHNSVFVVYFDENNGNPGNHIAVIAVGQPVNVGFRSNLHRDHYNWTRTLLSMYDAPLMANAISRSDITECWKPRVILKNTPAP